MKQIWKKRIAICLFASLLANFSLEHSVFAKTNTTYNSTNETLYQETASDIANRLSDVLVNKFGASSVQYALIDQDQIVLNGTSGYADVEKKEAPTSDTMYGIGSISKIYTTVAVMKLVEQGKVELDQPVIKYLPEFKMEDERYKDITVRMLLNHSSGLRGGSLHNGMLLGDMDGKTSKEFLNDLSRQTLVSEPGLIATYCNDGFTLAEILIEKVSGQSYTTFVHKYVITPLKLANTMTAGENFVTSKLAKIYDAKGEELPREVITYIGAGGIYSTASDLCTFAMSFMKDSNGLLSRDSVNLMSNEEYRNSIWYEDEHSLFSFGLGWDNVSLAAFDEIGIKAVEKGGDTCFYHSDLIVLPEENVAVAVCSVGGSSSYNKQLGKDILLAYLNEKERIDLTNNRNSSKDISTGKEIIPIEYLDYSGIYGNISDSFQVEVKKDIITIKSISNNTTTSYHYLSDGWFTTSDEKNQMRFIAEKNGEIYLYFKQVVDYLDLGSDVQGLYFAQKLSDEVVDESAMQAWLDRCGKVYFAVNEKYSSYAYAFGLPMLGMPTKALLFDDSHFFNMTVIDSERVEMKYQIPMLLGRDQISLVTEIKDGNNYIKQNNLVFISRDDINYLTTNKQFNVSIPDSGYAKYYKLPKDSFGKVLKFSLPNEANVCVFDIFGRVVFNSYLENKTKVTLPVNGYIVFMGDPGTEIKAKYVK